MKLIDGKMIAAQKLLALHDVIDTEELEPKLAVILVGDDPASHLYVKLKMKAAKEIGIELRTYMCEADTPREEIAKSIDFLNADPDTHGIIVQLPLPAHLDADDIVNLIDPMKDVDGFHKENQKRFIADQSFLYPVFPGAIMQLIESEIPDLQNKKAVVLGKSDVFDRVMTHALAQKGCVATFIGCTQKECLGTKENEVINQADIIVTAIGKAGYISCDIIKDDAVVIDGGISKNGDKIYGDVDRANCHDRDIAISPVPGGVGPVTIACLLENIVQCALAQKSQHL